MAGIEVGLQPAEQNRVPTLAAGPGSGWSTGVHSVAPLLKEYSESEFSQSSTDGLFSREPSFPDSHLGHGSPTPPPPSDRGLGDSESPKWFRGNQQDRNKRGIKQEKEADGGTLNESDIQDILDGKFRCISEGPTPTDLASQLPGPVSTLLKNEVAHVSVGMEIHSPFRAMNAAADKSQFELKQEAQKDKQSSEMQAVSTVVKRKGQKARVVRACLPCRLSKLKCDDQRPCANCARNGGSSLCVSWIVGKGQKASQAAACLLCNQERCACDTAMLLGKRSAADALPIERPPVAPRPEIVFENERSAQRRAQVRLFSHQILARYWEAGYSAEALLGIFRALPSQLRSSIWEGLDALSFLASLGAPLSALDPNADIPAPVTFEIPDAGPGTLVMGWDPTAQVRTFVSANQTCGLIARVHLEEFLARIANNELMMMQSELEWLCNMIDDLISATKPVNIRYLRYSDDYRAPEASDLCKLIKSTTVTKLDPMGRGVISATHQIEVVSDEAYDQALLSAPETCRPFSAMLGDVRTAAELRRDWGEDLRRRGKISEMKKTAEGRELLERLTGLIKVVFQPIIGMAEGARMQAGLSAQAPPQHAGATA